LIKFGGINAGEPYRALLGTDLHLERIAIAHPQHGGGKAG
jgi:hypothetical protein